MRRLLTATAAWPFVFRIGHGKGGSLEEIRRGATTARSLLLLHAGRVGQLSISNSGGDCRATQAWSGDLIADPRTTPKTDMEHRELGWV